MRNREVQIKFYATEKERESIRRKREKSRNENGRVCPSGFDFRRCFNQGHRHRAFEKAAHELAKQGTNLNQFMKFLNTYGVKVFDPDEAKRVLEKESRHSSNSWKRSTGAPKGSRQEQCPSANRGF